MFLEWGFTCKMTGSSGAESSVYPAGHLSIKIIIQKVLRGRLISSPEMCSKLYELHTIKPKLLNYSYEIDCYQTTIKKRRKYGDPG